MLENKVFSIARTRFTLLLLLCSTLTPALAGPGDLNIDGVFEAAFDIPRILFLLKRDPNGPPLKYQGNFELNWAFLDTGASGILLSRETTDYLEISIDPNAQYADVGIGGIELFDVSEALYIATADYLHPDPYDPNNYFLSGPGRLQIKQTLADPLLGGPLDILGMPVMAGKTVVLNAGAPNRLESFSADIKPANDPAIPEVDFTVPLRFEKYINLTDPLNIPPLPVLAYNPVIDNVTAEYDGNSVTGTWLLDTGAAVSLMSGIQAAQLGLTDQDGNPLITPDFEIQMGGIGGTVNVPGFEIDNLIIPTLNGFDLVFNNARIGVHNIGIINGETGELEILDGVFGSNFLCASAKIVGGWPVDLAEGPFETVVIDMQQGLLGFDVNDIYPLPTCGDSNHPKPTADVTGDCRVNLLDLYALKENWLRSPCNSGNNYCDNTDINQSGQTDLADYALVTAEWLESPFKSTCGDPYNPRPEGDFNRDCYVDVKDLQVFAEEWLNDCDWLNWNCRGADLDSDNTANLNDYADFVRNW